MARRRSVPAGKQRIRVETGIYLKANGRYLATFRDPGGRQLWKEFGSQREAQLWRARGRASRISASPLIPVDAERHKHYIPIRGTLAFVSRATSVPSIA